MASFRDMTTTKVLKVGTYIGEFATPGIGQILKSAGCEFVFLDMEHSGFSFETSNRLCVLCTMLTSRPWCARHRRKTIILHVPAM